MLPVLWAFEGGKRPFSDGSKRFKWFDKLNRDGFWDTNVIVVTWFYPECI